ncbi:hypothetical protein ACFTWF_03175 [Rhodococcus sp. NPDC056960]|uniref:hypothetical protein n=1 Tax=Rhodococcus sp. NPDC056960 TaxID=3345982 RepID=UPI00363B6C24
MFKTKTPSSTATTKENSMNTPNRNIIPGVGPRIDAGRGWLSFEFYPDDIANQIDEIRTTDIERLKEIGVPTTAAFERPTHKVERQLLSHIGFHGLPRDLATLVTGERRPFTSGGMTTTVVHISYRWPALEDIGVEEAPYLPPTDISGHITKTQAVQLVSRVHREAAFNALKAFDDDNLATARSWLDALVAHTESPCRGGM